MGRFDTTLQPGEYADLTALRNLWTTEKTAFWAYINGLTEEDLGREFQYVGAAGKRTRKVWQALWHVVNHGTQHRAECAGMLTALGHSPGDMDLMVYLRQRD